MVSAACQWNCTLTSYWWHQWDMIPTTAPAKPTACSIGSNSTSWSQHWTHHTFGQVCRNESCSVQTGWKPPVLLESVLWLVLMQCSSTPPELSLYSIFTGCMKLASHKHFFLCFFYQSAFCLTHTHPQSNASNFVFVSRPRIFSMQPGAARSQTTNLQGLNRCPARPPELWEWKNEGGTPRAGAGRQLQPSCCLHWLRDASSFPLISSGVCSLCEYAAVLLWWVAEAVMIKQAVIIMKNPLHPLHHLLDSLTGNFAAWHSTAHASPASTSETNVWI